MNYVAKLAYFSREVGGVFLTPRWRTAKLFLKTDGLASFLMTPFSICFRPSKFLTLIQGNKYATTTSRVILSDF
jgi:hypothetical protein